MGYTVEYMRIGLILRRAMATRPLGIVSLLLLIVAAGCGAPDHAASLNAAPKSPTAEPPRAAAPTPVLDLPPINIPASILGTTTTDSLAHANEYSAFYERRVWALECFKGQRLKSTEFRRLVLCGSAAVERYGAFDLPFDPKAERIGVNSLEVRGPAGEPIASGKASDSSIVDGAAAGSVLHVPVPGLRVGCTIEITVTRELIEPGEIAYYVRMLGAKVPILHDSVFVHGDLDLLRLKSSAGLAAKELGHGRVWTSDNPPVLQPEPFQQHASQFAPTVWISDARLKWESEVSRFLNKLAALPAGSINLKAMAASAALKPDSSNEAKIAALSQYVQRRLAYTNRGFGPCAFLPRRCDDILSSGAGDCKDHAYLLQQMLLSQGIPAHLALVNTAEPICADMPTIYQFNHVIVFVPIRGKNRFIDTTAKDADATGPVPIELVGKEALILDAANPRIETIVAPADLANGIETQRTIRCKEPTLEISERVVFVGHPAASLRSALKSVEPPQRLAWLQRLIDDRNGGQLVQTFSVEGLDDPASPLILTATYTVARGFEVDGATALVRPACFWEPYFAGAPHLTNRRTPFEVFEPFKVSTTVVLEIPPGWIADPTALRESNGKCPGAAWSRTVKQKENQLTVTVALILSPTKQPAEAYTEYQRTIEGALEGLMQPLKLKRLP